MATWQAHFFSFVLRHTFKPRLARAQTMEQVRAAMSGAPPKTPATVRITSAEVGGVPGEWVESAAKPDGPAGPTLLYLHGGGYFACSPRTHRPYTIFFALRGFKAFAPDYRLAPEHPFPAAVLDAVAVYRALRSQLGPSAPITIAGDSAGGGLALAAMLKLRDEGDALPAAAALFSPFTDLAGSGKSRLENSKRCAMFYSHSLERARRLYLGDHDPRDPLASPLYAELKGLPPLLIHVGASETLRDDSLGLADRARAAGVSVDLKVWKAVPHVWQLFRIIPESRESLDLADAFLKKAAG